MCTLKVDKACECLEKIEISSYDEYALKKASLLNQLNKKKEAKELITSTIAFVSQQRYSENKNASLIGYANLVARALWTIFDGQELFSDSLYEDNTFNCRKVVIKSKESIIETIFENQQPQNRRINSFNPNSYTINYIIGSTNETKKIEASLNYLLLQDILCIGIYIDHKNATDVAIKTVDNTSESPLWRWYKILSTNDKNIYNLYFTRERIYNARLECVEMFYDQILSLLEIGIGESKNKEKLVVDTKTLTDIASKMTIVLDEKRIVRLVDVLIQIDITYTDVYDKKTIINDALKIICYSFNSKILSECIDCILDNRLLDYRFTSYFEDIEYDLDQDKEQRVKEKLINSIRIEFISKELKIRDNAINKFKLFEKQLVDTEWYDEIVEKVWKQVDNFGLPLNNTYLPIAWIGDIKHNAKEKIIEYLLKPEISSNYQEGVISHGGKANTEVYGYCTVLYQMLEKENIHIFSREQLCSIIKYFYNYVKNEKKILDGGCDIMGEVSQTKERLFGINNIVLLLCISAKVSELYNEEIGEEVEAFLTQMDEIKIQVDSTKMILGDIDAKEIFAEFEKKILCGDEKETSSAFTMLYGVIRILQSQGKENDISRLVIQFIQRMPYLEMRIGKRIMRELHNVLCRKVFLDEENKVYVVNMMKTCYDIFRNAKEERIKDGLDGMYNVSNLAKTYYGFLKENSIEIGSEFKTLIDEFKECRLNEIKFNWR